MKGNQRILLEQKKRRGQGEGGRARDFDHGRGGRHDLRREHAELTKTRRVGMLINKIFKIQGGCFYGCRMMCGEYVQIEGMYLLYKSNFRRSLNRETRDFSRI